MTDLVPASWALYFPNQAFSSDDRRVLLIQYLCKFFLTEAGWCMLSSIRLVLNTQLVLPLDFAKLCNASGIADLEAAVELQPAECLGCLGSAVYEVLFETEQYAHDIRRLLGTVISPSYITVRPFNVPRSIISIRSVHSGSIGKLVTVKGTVVRLLHPRLVITQLDFACMRCGKVISIECSDGRVRMPERCSDGCRSKSFKADTRSAMTADWQKVRLQELLSVAQQEGQGTAARSLEIELSRDLVNACCCGDTVSVLGLVRVMEVAGAPGKGKAGGGLMLLYVEAVSLINHTSPASAPQIAQVASHSVGGGGAAACAAPHLTLKDLHFVATFIRTCAPHHLAHLVHSLSPAILGHAMAKAGIVLALLGGVRKHENDANRVATRGSIHVMLVGDPGLGKSQLLRAAAAAAPRGMYVCSSTASSAGLTVSVVRDVVSNDMAFEAGALVLADQGVCCLDEFDNMRDEHKTLLEVMEQQEVSAAKAGLTALMPARTTVIAAANPVGGVYSRAKTLQENLRMGSALLSRFDLTFVLLDEADEERDHVLSEHVMTMHAGGADQESIKHLTHPGAELVAKASEGDLKRQLEAYRCDNPLPMQLMQRYIAYARQFSRPQLSAQAKQVLKDFYISLRQQAAAAFGLSINTRHLESLIRLAEARARADLREEVTAQDAADAVELLRFSMRDFFADSRPVVQCAPVGQRGGRAEAQRFITALRSALQARARGGKEFSLAELHVVADDIGLQVHNLSELVESLNHTGDLLKKGPQLYAVA